MEQAKNLKDCCPEVNSRILLFPINVLLEPQVPCAVAPTFSMTLTTAFNSATNGPIQIPVCRGRVYENRAAPFAELRTTPTTVPGIANVITAIAPGILVERLNECTYPDAGTTGAVFVLVAVQQSPPIVGYMPLVFLSPTTGQVTATVLLRSPKAVAAEAQLKLLAQKPRFDEDRKHCEDKATKACFACPNIFEIVHTPVDPDIACPTGFFLFSCPDTSTTPIFSGLTMQPGALVQRLSPFLFPDLNPADTGILLAQVLVGCGPNMLYGYIQFLNPTLTESSVIGGPTTPLVLAKTVAARVAELALRDEQSSGKPNKQCKRHRQKQFKDQKDDNDNESEEGDQEGASQSSDQNDDD